MFDEFGQLLVASVLIFADDPRHLEPGDLLHQKHVQQTVGGVRFRHGIEAAAVIAAVAYAHEGHVSLDPLVAQLHHIMLRDPLDHVHHRAGGVGPEAMEQREPLVAGYVRADPGVQTHGADVQGDVAVTVDQVEHRFLRVQKTFQIEEGIGLAEELGEIVAASAGEHGDGGVVTACRTLHHFVERAVTAAGVEPQFLSGLRRFPGDPGALTGGGGDPDLVIKTLLPAQPVDHFAVFRGPVPTAGGGIDDE